MLDANNAMELSKQRNSYLSSARLSFVLKIPLHYVHPSIIYSVPCDEIIQMIRTYCRPELTFHLSNIMREYSDKSFLRKIFFKFSRRWKIEFYYHVSQHLSPIVASSRRLVTTGSQGYNGGSG